MNKMPRPKYHFCWWCSRHLCGRTHVIMRASTDIANVNDVIVHRACADEMECDGGWIAATDAAA